MGPKMHYWYVNYTFGTQGAQTILKVEETGKLPPVFNILVWLEANVGQICSLVSMIETNEEDYLEWNNRYQSVAKPA